MNYLPLARLLLSFQRWLQLVAAPLLAILRCKNLWLGNRIPFSSRVNFYAWSRLLKRLTGISLCWTLILDLYNLPAHLTRRCGKFVKEPNMLQSMKGQSSGNTQRTSINTDPWFCWILVILARPALALDNTLSRPFRHKMLLYSFCKLMMMYVSSESTSLWQVAESMYSFGGRLLQK